MLNADNAITRAFAKDCPGKVRFFSRETAPENGVFLREGVIYRSHNGEKTKLMDAESILLPGLHNVENYMAAFAATDGIVSDDTCRAVAESFRGVAHRRNDPDAAWRYLLQRFHCIQPHAHDRGTSRAAAEAHPYCGRVR